MATIAVIGETVADVFIPAEQPSPGVLDLRVRPGGGPANTAVALGRLGVPTRFAGRLPTGPLGDLLRSHLAGSQVDLTTAVTADEQPTLALTTVDASGQARYGFYTMGTADFQWTKEELESAVPHDAICLHTGSLALALEPAGPLIADLLRARRGGATISIDPNIRPGVVPLARYRSLLPEWISTADILRLSLDDLHLMLPGAGLEETCATWHAAGVRLIVVTLGADGAYASIDGHGVTVPARPVHPVDTVGAGDAFTAGLLYRLRLSGVLKGKLDALTPELLIRSLTFASDVAAETCRAPGADPPWLHDMP